jgi:hypothetical protein
MPDIDGRFVCFDQSGALAMLLIRVFRASRYFRFSLFDFVTGMSAKDFEAAIGGVFVGFSGERSRFIIPRRKIG